MYELCLWNSRIKCCSQCNSRKVVLIVLIPQNTIKTITKDIITFLEDKVQGKQQRSCQLYLRWPCNSGTAKCCWTSERNGSQKSASLWQATTHTWCTPRRSLLGETVAVHSLVKPMVMQLKGSSQQLQPGHFLIAVSIPPSPLYRALSCLQQRCWTIKNYKLTRWAETKVGFL